jgi:hypothetical protein
MFLERQRRFPLWTAPRDDSRPSRKRLLAAALAGLLCLPAHPARPSNLSSLADEPDWRQLDAYQGTITHDEFASLLEQVYAPHGGWQPYIRVDPDAAVIRKSNIPLEDLYTLRFAPAGAPARPRPPAYWRPRAAIPPLIPPAGRPLAGVKIALDPGHLGGRWARMEERWFQIGNAPPVMEGEMTLAVARLLAPRLRALGAQPMLLRDSDEPATPLRPYDLLDDAARALRDEGIAQPPPYYKGPADPDRQFTLAWMSEALFSRAEIRARGEEVNEVLHPDLVVCLHFNAEAWGDPARPVLVDKNHLHVIINGCYEPDELAKDDVRCELLLKLLNHSHAEELAIADAVAPVLARATGLPPYVYKGNNARLAGADPYVWERNLLANRIDRCPVIYIEPYVMNSPGVFARIQAGDYAGTRDVGGVQRKSIYREYADAVAAGLAGYYRQRP